MSVKLHNVISCIIVLFSWLGLFSYFVSSTLGGVIYIGFSYFIVLAYIFPKICLNGRGNPLFWGLISFLIFAFVTFIGYELLVEKGATNSFLVFEFSATGFNILKNLPLWCSGFLLLLDRNQTPGLKNVFYLVLAYDVIITIVALYFDPAFSKNMAAGIVTGSMSPFLRMGAMGYELTYSVSIVAPVIIADGLYFRNKLVLLLGLLCCYFVFSSSFMIGLVALVMNLLLCCLFCIPVKSNRIRVFLVISAVVVGIVLALSGEWLANFLITLSNQISSQQLSERFYQIGRLLLYGDSSGDAMGRLDLYSEALVQGVKSPVLGQAIFGTGYSGSGHSTILDGWSLFGLAGLIPFLSMTTYSSRSALLGLGKKALRGTVISASITFLFIALFDPVLAGPQILLSVIWVVPVIAASWKNEPQSRVECIKRNIMCIEEGAYFENH